MLEPYSRCVVIDTNVLIYSYLNRFDIFSYLKDLGFKRFYVPSKVVEELKRYKKDVSNFTLHLIKRFCEVVDVDASGTDFALIELSRSKGCVLITNDKKLRKIAKDFGLHVGYVREYKKIELE